MYELARVYAFHVQPQRDVDDADLITPGGGIVKVSPRIKSICEDAFGRLRDSRLSTVHFDFSGLERDQHPVRNDIIKVAFGTTRAPVTAARALALRLSQTMDHRSHPALLLIVGEADDTKRRVTLFVLPKEHVIQAKPGAGDELDLDWVANAFAASSSLRKVARLHGHDAPSQFLSVSVVDRQMASLGARSAADFWVKRFLLAKASMDGITGTQKLAAALQRAFDKANDDDERDAVFTAIFAARSEQRQVSLAEYAKRVPIRLRPVFLGSENEETKSATFAVDRELMRATLGRRIFTGVDGVVVSAPPEAINRSVIVSSEGGERTVQYNGVVKREQMQRGKAPAKTAAREKERNK